MKKSLLSLGLMFIFSFVMLLGTTYAWWHQTINVDDNIIQMGNLNLNVQYYDQQEDVVVNGTVVHTYYDLNNADPAAIFNDHDMQPGSTNTKYLVLTNDGSIALKYELGISVDMTNPLREYITFITNDSGSGNLENYLHVWRTLQPGEQEVIKIQYNISETLGDADGTFGQNLSFPWTMTFNVEQDTRPLD